MVGADKFMVFFDHILHIADNRAQGGEAYPHCFLFGGRTSSAFGFGDIALIRA